MSRRHIPEPLDLQSAIVPSSRRGAGLTAEDDLSGLLGSLTIGSTGLSLTRYIPPPTPSDLFESPASPEPPPPSPSISPELPMFSTGTAASPRTRKRHRALSSRRTHSQFPLTFTLLNDRYTIVLEANNVSYEITNVEKKAVELFRAKIINIDEVIAPTNWSLNYGQHITFTRYNDTFNVVIYLQKEAKSDLSFKVTIKLPYLVSFVKDFLITFQKLKYNMSNNRINQEE